MTLQGILRQRNKVWPQGEAVRTATVPVRAPNGDSIHKWARNEMR